jgi:hypothetical protein
MNTEIARSHRHGDGHDPFGLGTCLNPAGMGGTILARLAGVEGSHCVSSCWTYLGQIVVMRTGRYVEVFTQMVVATPPAVGELDGSDAVHFARACVRQPATGQRGARNQRYITGAPVRGGQRGPRTSHAEIPS